MRTTLDLNGELLRQAKELALKEGRPLRAVVEDALQQFIAKPRSRKPYKFEWRVESGRLNPGIRLDDRNWLLDFMDER
jgi:hypothetical protein